MINRQNLYMNSNGSPQNNNQVLSGKKNEIVFEEESVNIQRTSSAKSLKITKGKEEQS